MSKKLLIVEDDEMWRFLYRHLLKEVPEVEIAAECETGEEALEKIAQIHPDLAIVDLTLRGMDGMELIEAVRRAHASVKILLVSGHDPEVISESALKAGADDVVEKKRTEEIRTRILKLLEIKPR
jgi:DNA-binding NarL/FixJ family response regulator